MVAAATFPSVVRWVRWLLAQHWSETRKPSITVCLFGWRARPCDVECCPSSVSVRPSIHVRFQWHGTPCQLWVLCTREHVCGHAERKKKERAHRHTCAPSPSLVSRCASITPQHLVYMSSLPCGPCSIKSDDWLSVGIKRNPILVCSLGTSLEGYWLIHHLVNMDFSL